MMKVGDRVFFFHQRDGWEMGIVRECSAADVVTVTNAKNPTERLPLSRKLVYLPSDPSVFGEHEVPPDDLLALPELHLSILLHTLRLRHSADVCYTYIGDLVVALNPFRYTIPHYQDSLIGRYLACAGNPSIDTASRGQLKPHPWSVAHRVYHNMRAHRRSQTIIISGESGSGKTEACKMLLHYLCLLSTRVAAGATAGAAGHSTTFDTSTATAPEMQSSAASISNRVHQSNPILEAFGNAKTARNDNSSRFGKLMEVTFDASGALVGMRITAYLLEKLRVVTAANDERIYHSFYLLACGAPDATRRKYGITSPRDFRVLNAGGCTMVRGIDEFQGFETVMKAFGQIGFGAEEVDLVWRVVAAILHLQNVSFVSATASKVSERSKAFDASGTANAMNSGSAMVDPSTLKSAQFVAKDLLDVDPAAFIESLVCSVNVVKNERVVRALSPHKAEEQRDTLCKHLYAKLFFWIVDRINQGIEEAAPPEATPANFIALLDIFGFEDFAHNSLEQLCINLANETLQRHYAKHVFERDRDEVTSDGVACEEPEFRDNQPCVDLIQGDRNSIFSFLDDASTLDLEKSSVDPNQSLLDKITKQFKPDYVNASAKAGLKSVLERQQAEMKAPGDYFHRARLDADSFTVLHYAGAVKYTVGGFVEKNTDVLKDSLRDVLLTSQSELVRMVVQMGTDGDNAASFGGASPSNQSRFSASSPLSPRGGGAAAGANAVRRKASACAQFRASLKELMRTIDDTQPSWVRCIRPHPKKQPGAFDGRSVLEQVVATGILETVTQRQRNFPFRIPIDEFVHRFGFMAIAETGGGARSRLRQTRMKRPVREICGDVVDRYLSSGAGGARADAQTGKTKVYLRAAAYAKLHAESRRLLARHVLTLSAFVDGCVSLRVATTLRFEDACAKCRRVFRLHRTLNQLRAAAWEAIRRAIVERHAAERGAVLREETARRREQLDMGEARERARLLQPFLVDLLPMIAQVLDNIQGVEAAQRQQCLVAEAAARSSVAERAAASATEAERRLSRRVAGERAQRIEESSRLLDAKARLCEALTRDEGLERGAIARRWEPVKRHMEGLWVRAEALRRQRDTHVEWLKKQRDREVARLASQEERRCAAEAQRWRDFVGRSGLRRDVTHFANVGLPPDEAVAQMQLYYAHGGPSAVLSPRNRHAAQQSSDAPHSPSFRGVRSYAQYAEAWRTSYAAAAAHRETSPSPRAEGLAASTSRGPQPIAGSLSELHRDVLGGSTRR
jgi:myosin heavy subunit